MASTIATLTEKNGSFEGTLKTLAVTVPIAIVQNATKKEGSNEPDYRVIAKKNGFELARAGTGSRNRPARTISASPSAPRNSARSTATWRLRLR